MELTSLGCLLALNSISCIRGSRFNRLLDAFGSPEAVWQAKRDELLGVQGFSGNLVGQFFSEKQDVCPEKALKAVQKEGVSVVTFFDNDYPKRLRDIYDPPPVLFIRGELQDADIQSLAIVGSRQATGYGLTVARKFARELAQANVTVVSGLARGIDTAAHRGALEGKGRTVAVLGSGIDVPYPRENKKLMEDIAASGACISEFPLQTAPLAMHFPMRNRIIAGISMGVLVVQAKERSGASITADFALEQGKDVFAVPGNIDVLQSRGPHGLIKQGAKLAEDVADILEDMGISPARNLEKSVESAHGAETQVFETLHFDPKHIDTVIEETSLSISEVSTALLLLQMKGLIRELPGKLFVRAR